MSIVMCDPIVFKVGNKKFCSESVWMSEFCENNFCLQLPCSTVWSQIRTFAECAGNLSVIQITCRAEFISLNDRSIYLPGGGGVLHNFQYWEVHANIWGLKIYVNQYLGSVNYNTDKNSIFRVHKSEKRKNPGIWCGSPKYWTQYLGSPKH